MQNEEKSLREIYEADPGKIFVQVDQSGAEALIVAYLCRAGRFRQLFENGIKPHVYVALRLFKDVWVKKMKEARLITGDSDFNIAELIATPIPELRNNPYWKSVDSIIKDSDNWPLSERYYYLAKQTCHSGNYDVTPPTFRMNVLEKSGGKIMISKENSELFNLTYKSLFPEIFEWHGQVRKQIETTGFLYNLHGHPFTHTAPEVLDSKWKEMYAWVPQSTVGEITNIAYAKAQTYIEENMLPWDLLANTHDSYLVQCPVGSESVCARTLQGFMAQTFTSPIDSVQFTMRSEAQCGYNWAPAKKDKNPNGLSEAK